VGKDCKLNRGLHKSSEGWNVGKNEGLDEGFKVGERDVGV
jgi:hypothetical protein|tara:strand:- start:827 stop:946 length:120 start_codon:yes stop_codon:yes gene_type:complete